MTTPAKDCKACNACDLALMLFRVSPISKQGDLMPPGAASVISDDALMTGLVPPKPLKRSRFVLRLLRAGYVHVYIPSPPPGVKQWHVYRVTDQADLVAQDSAWFKDPAASVKCSTTGHNAMGLKVLRLPRGHLISDIWIAFSANLWGDTLRQRNKANPKAMQHVKLAGGSPNTFKPTVANLRSKVLECALPRLRIDKAEDHDFPFNGLSADTETLAGQLERLAASHPKTRGKELAVVLDDRVGIATELNAMRLRRNGVMENFIAKPENLHPLEVNKVIEMLKGNLMARSDEAALNRAVPLQTREAYDKSTYPPGTCWQALTAEEKEVHAKRFEEGNWLGKLLARPAFNRLSANDVGRVVYPDYETRVEFWAEQRAKEDWKKFLEFYDETKRAAWERNFDATIKAQHLDELQLYEEDWDVALKDPQLVRYFEIHFDEGANNVPIEVARHGCCAGTTYMREAVRAFVPEPKTSAARETFESQLDADVSQPNAILLRAMFANQESLWSILTTTDGKRDKTYDFMKGLIGEFVATKTADGKNPMRAALAKRVSWLTDINMGFSLGIYGVLAAVATRGVSEYWERRAAAKTSAIGKIDPKILSRLTRAESMALIHRACEEALKAVQHGAPVKVPVLLMANVSVETLVQIRRARGEMMSIREIRNLRRKGQVTLAILTDTQTLTELRVAPGDAVHALGASASNTIHINEHALSLKSTTVQKAASGARLTIPVSRFLPLYEKQILTAAAAPPAFKAWLKSLTTKVAASNVRAATMSVEGRLAVGTMIVQGIGAWNGLQKYLESNDAEASTDAFLGMADGMAGVIGGAAEFGAKWTEVVLKEAAEQGSRLAALRAVAAGMGVAGNVVNAWMAFREAGKLRAAGSAVLAEHMKRAGWTFIAGLVPLGLQFAHQLTVFGLRRGATSAGLVLVERQLGRMVAARIGTMALGLTVPGVGWALTAVAVGQTIYVVLSTPTPVEAWLKYCYFGKPDRGESTRKNWEEEDKAWKALQGPDNAKAA